MRAHRLPLTWLAAAAVIAACVRPDPDPRYTPAWEPFDPTEERWVTSRKALLMADCQVHNLLSKAVPDRNLSTEALAATAIRPPQLDLFAPDVLAWVASDRSEGCDVILHMGDALDFACKGELDTFLEVMDGVGKPWFMTPGNHDFFYLGSYDPQDLELWESACHRAGGPLPKDLFIRLYVASLLRRDAPRSQSLGAALGLGERRGEPLEVLAEGVPDAFEWRAPEGVEGLLDRIAWSIDRERPWRSFLLQSIDLTRAGMEEYSPRALLLDSCQFARRPELVPNAWSSWPVAINCGLTGEMLPDQLRTARRWIEESWGRESYSLMAHHPFDSLAPRTRSSLGWLWRERGAGVMVSAHTHAGYFAHHDLGGEDERLELNLGSTTDWPMEWRTLAAYIDPERQQIYVHAERETLVDVLQHEQGFFQPGWEIPAGAPDDYRKYKQGESAGAILFDFYLVHHLVPYWMSQPRIRPNAAARHTEEQVKDTLLWTYFRLVRDFPTDAGARPPAWPSGCASDREVQDRILALAGREDALETKIGLLEQLGAFERSRSTRDPESGEPSDDARLRYKLSQAAWASRFEAEQGRRLRVEDELIRVDWERSRRAREAKAEAMDAEPGSR